MKDKELFEVPAWEIYKLDLADIVTTSPIIDDDEDEDDGRPGNSPAHAQAKQKNCD